LVKFIFGGFMDIFWDDNKTVIREFADNNPEEEVVAVSEIVDTLGKPNLVVLSTPLCEFSQPTPAKLTLQRDGL
jgi:hypothetical protein